MFRPMLAMRNDEESTTRREGFNAHIQCGKLGKKGFRLFLCEWSHLFVWLLVCGFAVLCQFLALVSSVLLGTFWGCTSTFISGWSIEIDPHSTPHKMRMLASRIRSGQASLVVLSLHTHLRTTHIGTQNGNNGTHHADFACF